MLVSMGETQMVLLLTSAPRGLSLCPMARINGCQQGLLAAPSSLDSLFVGARTYAKHLQPFSQALRYSVQSNTAVAAGIALLFNLQAPTTVLWAIFCIVIASLQAMLRAGAWPHIVVERFKRAFPGFADRNTSGSITMKSCIFRVIATPAHIRPCHIFWTVSQAVFVSNIPQGFTPQTSATACQAREEATSCDKTARATLTLTPPLRLRTRGIGSTFYNGKTIKRQSMKIAEFAHNASFSGMGLVRHATREGCSVGSSASLTI